VTIAGCTVEPLFTMSVPKVLWLGDWNAWQAMLADDVDDDS
jgi:hypothetical protein